MTVEVHPAQGVKVAETFLREHHTSRQIGFRFVFLEKLMQNTTFPFVACTSSRYLSAFSRNIFAASDDIWEIVR
jgi:hypothetical protein